MDIRAMLKSQYHAAMAMLRPAIEECPDELWLARGAGDRPDVAYWRIAFHALFYTHLYMQPDEKSFRPWSGHREQNQFLEDLPMPPFGPPKISEPHTQAELMEYWRQVDAMVDPTVDALDLDSPQCGFWWYDMGKLEHQVMNIRHTQHHAAQLLDRLRASAVTRMDWVGGKASQA